METQTIETPSPTGPGRRKAFPTDPKERFKEAAPRRVGEVLAGIRKVGNLASGDYDYSDQDAKKVVRAIKNATEVLEAKLLLRQPHLDTAFSLD